MSSIDNGFPSVAPPTESGTFRMLHRRSSHTRLRQTKQNRKPTAHIPLAKPKPTAPNQPTSTTNAAKSANSPQPTPEEGVVDFTNHQDADEEVDPNADASTSAPEKRKVRPGSYEHLGLSAPICSSMRAAGYNFPTPIQRKVIPPILAGDDVVAMARTGSGKTAAFLAPILHRLTDESARPRMSVSSRRNGPRALIIAPTRELVLQELKFSRLYSRQLPRAPRTAVVVGGTPLDAQFEALAVCPELLFATPGRLLQILAEMGARRALTLSTVETLVLDEADRLFEGTLAVETARLLDALRDRATENLASRQTILVSATMPLALAEFSRSGLRPCLSVVRLDVERVVSPTLAVSFVASRGDIEKDAALIVIIRRAVNEGKSAVVFAATHRRVDYLTNLLRDTVISSVGCVHGDMDQPARQDAVLSFRKHRTTVLVVTDVAARGIDLPDLNIVVNYDVSPTPKLFVHRVGRAGRAGKFGLAFNLVTADEIAYMLDVFLFVGRSVRLAGAGTDGKSNAFESNPFAMDTTFLLGSLPKSIVDEEVELVRKAVEDADLDKSLRSARNAHKLYVRTRGIASGESVRRAKELLRGEDGSRRTFHVHPWFADMESEAERAATEHVSRLSSWRPKESAVPLPSKLIARVYSKSVATGSNEEDGHSDKDDGDDDEPMPEADTHWNGIPASDVGTSNGVTQGKKISSRQAAIEEERRNFFLPTRQGAQSQRVQKALRVKSGGAMGDDLSAYRELNDAAMDMRADSNADLLRAKHTGGSSAKFWDRVSKKFVKGGPSAATSKRNLHVASREAKARATGGGSYATDDGELYKKWLSKNRKAVEELSEQVNQEGGADAAALFRSQAGLSSNDFRKGAFGRRARIAAAAKTKQRGVGQDNKITGQKPELKTADQIRKTRKLKAKAEVRRAKHARPKGNGKGKANQQAGPQRGSSKTRVIVRKK